MGHKRYYVPNSAGVKCDWCTGFLPASEDVWVFLHRDGVCRIFCSSACCAGYALHKTRGEIAREGEPWAKALFRERDAI